MGLPELPPTSRRVEQHTSATVNAKLHRRTQTEITRAQASPPREYQARIDALDREWDIERVLQANAATLALAGTVLGWRVDRRFLLLPAVVFSFFLQHALQGWCPPVPVFRRLGVRTRSEIERERHALKALRGDFDDVPPPGEAHAGDRVRAVLAAIDR